jgi:predicted dehydrogenase
MTDPIRWGILGTGAIADSFTDDLARVPDAEAVAVAVGSRSTAAAARFAGRHGIGRAFGSWAELAADPDIDVVYVATPHTAHHAAASLCLEAGKAVLCEKPFTINAGEARRLVDQAQKHGVFLMEAIWMLTNPAIRRLVELVTDGAIGALRSVHADFGLAGPFEPDHRLRDPQLGGGALLDLGVYPVSLAHLLLGLPATIATSAQLTAEGVDANTGILIGYDSGAVALLSCSIEAASPCVATITGTRGLITLERPFFRPDGFLLHRNGAEPQQVSMPYDGLGYVHEIQETGRCLRAGLLQSPLVPWRHSLEVMLTLDSVREQIGVGYPSETVDSPACGGNSEALRSDDPTVGVLT